MAWWGGGECASKLEVELPSGSKELAHGEQRLDCVSRVVSVIDADAESAATEVIVAVNGDIPISGSPGFLSGKAGELDLGGWCEDVHSHQIHVDSHRNR